MTVELRRERREREPRVLDAQPWHGHVRGAFTDAKADRAGCFELADGGTLLLDEIANMPLGQQAKLLALRSSERLRQLEDDAAPS